MNAEPETHHVFAWATGFGWTVVPFAPYRFEMLGERGLRVEHQSVEGRKAAVLTVSGECQGYEVVLEPGTAELSEVAEVFAGPKWYHWRVTSDVLHCSWPKGFAFVSLPGTKPPVFEWVGPDESRVWIRGPILASTLPPPDRLGTPDQRVEKINSLANGPLVELTYRHDNEPWRMFHAIHRPEAPLEEPRGLLRWLKPQRATTAYACVVSAQTPEEHAATVRTAVIEIAESLTPHLPEEP
jgi:hypothetical protein